jgi:hypothetical protein
MPKSSFFCSHLISFQLNKRFVAVCVFFLLLASQAHAAYTPFNTAASGNIGIGSVAPNGKLDVEGTFSTIFNATAASTGNVGIGSFTPGQRLDVRGTVRALGFNMGTNGPASGYVLTASNSAGDATWTAAGSVGPWTQAGTNIYETGSNVGVGTTTPQGAFVVTNGNVGIGTWSPGGALTVMSGNVGIGTTGPPGSKVYILDTASPGATPTTGTYMLTLDNNVGWGSPSILFKESGAKTGSIEVLDVNPQYNDMVFKTSTTDTSNVLIERMRILGANGNMGLGTWAPASKLSVSGGASIGSNTSYASTTAPADGLIVQGNVGIGTITAGGGNLIVKGGGNVGIGSAWPGQVVDVQGTVRALGFAMGTNGPASGYVLTASDSFGDATWTAAGSVGPWTQAGTNIYETGSNVGVGTTTPQGAFVVTNGSVGIGTWAPPVLFDINGTLNSFAVTSSGSVGIGTWVPAVQLEVMGSGSTSINLENRDNNNALLRVKQNGSIAGYFGYTTSNSGTFGVFDGSSNSLLAFNSGSVGLGGTSAKTAPVMEVLSGGNVGIGSIAPNGKLDIEGTYPVVFNALAASTGNVGIGSFAPGAQLDVNGTARVTGFTLTGQGAGAGNVLVSNAIGVGTWMSPSSIGASGASATAAGGLNAIEYSSPLGTFAGSETKFSFNGTNIGIGTTNGASLLDVRGTLTISAFQVTTAGNVGIGTTTPQGGLVVTNGNVGIGTWAPAAALAINGSILFPTSSSGGTSSISIGAPTGTNGTTLSLNSGSGAAGAASIAGALNLTGGSDGDNSHSSFGGAINITGGSAFGINTNPTGGAVSIAGGSGSGNGGAVSIITGVSGAGGGNSGALALGSGASPAGSLGTISLVQGANTVMFVNSSGNVGIGTYGSNTINNKFTVIGNIGIGTGGSSSYVTTAAPNGGMIVQGNVGIGSLAPGQMIDVQGTVRALGFAMGTNGPASGYVLTASDSFGDATWTAAGSVGAWTQSGTFIYESGNNVGVGSLAPGAQLDVNGTARVTGFTLTGQGAAAGNVLVSSTVGVGTWMAGSTVAGSVNGLTTNYLPKALSSTQLTNSLIFDNGSNVGIGSANPTAALDINGGLSTGGSGDSYFSSGNLGIGSTAPGTSLDVNGTARMGGFTMNNGASSGYVLVTNAVGVGTWMSPTSIGASGGSGTAAGGLNAIEYNSPVGTFAGSESKFSFNGTNVGIGTTNGVSLLDVRGTVALSAFQVTSAGNVGIGTNTPQGGLVVTNGNVGIGTWAPRTFLDVEGTLAATYFAGNVGIGSITPGAALTLNYNNSSTTTPVLLIDNPNASAQNTILFRSANTSRGLIRSDSQGNLVLSPGNGGSTYINLSDLGTPGNVYIPTGSVGVGTTTPQGGFVITNGNVGIGTWAPRAILDVEGTVSVATFAGNVGIGSVTPGSTLDITTPSGGVSLPALRVLTSGTSYFSVGQWGYTNIRVAGDTVSPYNASLNLNTANDTAVGIAVRANSATQSSDLQEWQNSGGSNLAVVTAVGNIGIGTTAPSGKLDVEGTFPTVFNAVAASTGNVGIGSFTPGQRLDVRGTVRALGFTMATNGPASGYVLTASDSAGDATWTAAGSVGAWTQSGTNIYETGNNVGIGTTTPQGAFVVTNGNVGIGTWAPKALLDVQGTAQHLYVSTSGYVGIGSAAPGALLDVQGTTPQHIYITDTGNVGIGTSVTQSALYLWSGANFSVGGATALDSAGATAYIAGTLGVGGVNAGNGGTPYLKVSTDTNYVYLDENSSSRNMQLRTKNSGGTLQANQIVLHNTGNVGIGTAMPSGRLDVEGTFPVIFNALAASTGNVGINTFNPGVQLDVRGTVRALGFTMGTNGPASGYVLTASDSFGDATWTAAGSVGPWTQSGSLIYETGNNVGIGSAAPGTALDVNGTLRITGIGQLIMPNGNVGIGTSTPQGALVVTNGSVGIGTWSPSDLLTVVGLDGTRDVKFSNAPGTGYVTVNCYPGSTGCDIVGNGFLGVHGSSSTNNGLTLANGASGFVGNGFYFTGGNVGIGTTTPQGGFVVTNGNVGIGTWAPLVPLQINDPSNGLEVTNGSASMYLNNNQLLATGTPLYLNYNSTLGVLINATGGNVGIGTINPQGGLVVMTGNVGIGTWAPKYLLEVQGTVGMATLSGTNQTQIANDTLYLGTGNYSNFFIDRQGTTGNASQLILGFNTPKQTVQNGIFQIYNNSTDHNRLFMVQSAGTSSGSNAVIMQNSNVGIGTTVPKTALEVENGSSAPDSGTSTWDTSGGQLAISSTAANATDSGSALTFREISPVGTLVGYAAIKGAIETAAHYNGYLSFLTRTDAAYATERMRITSGGNVGIGSTVPVAMLNIAGGSGVVNEKSLTNSASISIDWSQSNQQYVTLGQVGTTITFSNIQMGETMRLILCQDGTGNRTVTTWTGATFAWSGGSAPVLSTAASACDIISFIGTAAKGSNQVFGSATKNF